MFLSLLIFSTYISIIDWQRQKISNRSLLFGLITFLGLSQFADRDLHLVSLLLCILVSPLLLMARVGAGDVKLLGLLAIFFLPNTLITLVNFLSAISIISSCLTLSTLLRRRTLATSIAFGPAICGAVIWCAR